MTSVEKGREKPGFGAATFGSFAKAGFGDGPTSKDFKDADWSAIDSPHDWVVETGFLPKAGTRTSALPLLINDAADTLMSFEDQHQPSGGLATSTLLKLQYPEREDRT